MSTQRLELPVRAAGGPAGTTDWLRLTRRAKRLSWTSLAWLGIEGTVGVVAGLAAGSVALVGFGLDSAIEALASVIVIWRFTGGRTLSAAAERRAQLLVAASFLLLAPYVAAEALIALVTGHRPEASWVGVALAVGSLCVCPWLGMAKRRLGARLGSPATAGEGRQNLLCAGLAGGVLVGLLANALWGLWWLDPAVALVIAGVAVREGVTSRRGESCPCCAPMAPVVPVAREPLAVLRAAPGGCSLDAAALARRAEDFRALAGRALIDAEPLPGGGLRLRYRRAPGISEEVARLARLESQCCSALAWRVAPHGDEVHLVVDGSPDAGPMLDALRGVASATTETRGPSPRMR